MSLHLGNKKVKELYLGNKRVTEMYLGNNLVYKYQSEEGGGGGEGGGTIKPTANGVYILGTDNKYYHTSEWNKLNSDAVGIFVLDGKISFLVAPSPLETPMVWSNQRVEVSGITSTGVERVASNDVRGFDNTKKIIAQDPNAEAAKACNNYKFKNGIKGYLPALGELRTLYNNKLEVNRALETIGSKPLGQDQYNDLYWSSTQNKAEMAWVIFLYDDYALADNKDVQSIILPFGKI